MYQQDLAAIGSRMDADHALTDQRLDDAENRLSELAQQLTALSARVAVLEAEPEEPEEPTEEEPPLVTGVLLLAATQASIGVELPIVDAGPATVRYRIAGGAWRDALPLWFSGEAYTGSVLRCQPGSTYDVRVTCGGLVYQETITTQDILAALPATTHTVGVDFATLAEAWATAPAGAVVAVSGSHPLPETARTTPLTLVGDGAVIESPHVIAPGAWSQVTLTGSATGETYTVWHAVSPLADPTMLQCEDGVSLPEVVATWDRPAKASTIWTMLTPEGWAEVLYRNDLYRYGFAAFGTDIYLRLPGDRDPNATPVRVHQTAGYDSGRLRIAGPGIRMSGITFNQCGVLLEPDATRWVIEDNQFVNCDVFLLGDQNVTPNRYPTDGLIQDNDFQHSSLYDRNRAGNAIAWKFIKGPMYIGGVKTIWSRVGDQHEITAVSGRGGGRRVIVRHNTIEGYFNGVGAYMQGYDRYGKSEYDIHDNTFRYIADDVFEPDQGAINWRVWDNDVSVSSVAVSLGPADRGPLYLFDNHVSDMTNDGVGPDLAGDTTVSVLMFKYSGDSNPPLLCYVVGNLFHSTDPTAMGGYKAAGGSGSPERFIVRNNIFVMSRYVFSARANSEAALVWDEDYNAWYTSDATRGMEYGGSNIKTIEAYRLASGQSAHSFGFHDPIVLNADGSLPDDSPLRGAGVVLPNIAEPADGSAPDIGG